VVWYFLFIFCTRLDFQENITSKVGENYGSIHWENNLKLYPDFHVSDGLIVVMKTDQNY